MRISYSAFDTFNRCPLKYKLGYIDRVKTPEKPEFFFGSLIHEVVQYALKRDPIIPPVDELLDHYKRRWREDAFATPLESEQYFRMGEGMIRNFHNGFKPGLRSIVGTEKRFYIPLNDKHTLNGVIDRVDKLPTGEFEVIDYKTSKTLPTQDNVDKDKQLCIYNLAVENLWPEAKNVRLTLYFLKHNSQLTTSRQPYEVEEIRDEIIKTADEIEKEKDWAPKQNPLCDWCEYAHLCPLRKQKLEKDAGEALEMDDIVSDYIAARKKIDDLEPKIHDHFDEQKIEKYYHKSGNLTRLKTGKISVSKN